MKVLVVDDNEDITELLENLLKSVGYDVTTTTDGKESLDLILKNSFDIVLLDITMPKFSGFDVVQSLKDSGKINKNNIIFFTAASIPEADIDKWIKQGVKGSLHKPINPDKMFEIINNITMEL